MTAASAGAREADTFVVTGSRIPAAVRAALEPLIACSKDRLDEHALTNIADGLDEQRGVRGSITPAGSMRLAL